MSIFRISLLSMAILGMLAGAAFAGEVSAKGRVIDKAGNLKSGIPVIITGPKGSSFVFTDKQGYWTLYGLPEGKYSAALANTPGLARNPMKFEVEGSSWWPFQKTPGSPKIPTMKLP